MAARFEVVVFTASQKIYAERLLDILDPGHELVRHRIYRDSCVVVDGNYLKVGEEVASGMGKGTMLVASRGKGENRGAAKWQTGRGAGQCTVVIIAVRLGGQGGAAHT